MIKAVLRRGSCVLKTMAQSSSNDNPASGVRGRVLLQQCLSARLMVKPPTEENPAEYVHVNRGIVAYVCFLKGACKDTVDKMVNCILKTRLTETENGKNISILDLPGDILIIPQATLGGRLKGRMMQYHGNIEKSVGESLYAELVERCQTELENSVKGQESEVKVKWGTYGNRQVFRMDTNGPYTHLVEF